MSSDGNAYDDYDYGHRAFLQAILGRPTLTLAEAKPLLAAIQTARRPDRPTLPEDITQEDLDNYIHTINNAISCFDLEIRKTLHQRTRERVYALVNTTSDALTQMSTVHSADEIAYVKRVLDAMFETYNGPSAEIMAVTSLQALRLAKPSSESQRRTRGDQETQSSTDAGLTIAQAERVLDLLVAGRWLELSNSGYYTLSPRALMELKGWLIETYNDTSEQDENGEEDEEDTYERIKFCAACREIVTMGQRCPNARCGCRAHNHCIRTLFRAHGGKEECPICKVGWVDPLPVGEMAAKGRDNGDGRGGRSLITTGAGRRHGSINETDAASRDNCESDNGID
ncbi:hypothetical protein M433DRAFT_99616 [Acidomyces richmondensis BFW]|nr:MAG: hypothetical protein FE78DRAFT_26884 [Acidomyces sp. 'richmondensis']KYG50192.1 hypothetical protein M433DRAFT_99616 [Acidomyces richmondensis BFW]